MSANYNTVVIDIPALSSNTTYGKLTKDPADTSVQQSPFLMGNGAFYRRYSNGGLSKTNEDWLTYLRGTPNLTLQSEKIITELCTPSGVYGTLYV